MILLPILFALGVSAVAQQPGAGLDDAMTASRRAARDLAGAWANDGFKLRDSHWTGKFAPGRPYVVRVSLFAGNRYWFTAAASGGGAISMSLHDESGKPMPLETYDDGPRSAAGFSPDASGPYFVKIEQRGDQGSTFCLVYSYK